MAHSILVTITHGPRPGQDDIFLVRVSPDAGLSVQTTEAIKTAMTKLDSIVGHAIIWNIKVDWLNFEITL